MFLAFYTDIESSRVEAADRGYIGRAHRSGPERPIQREGWERRGSRFHVPRFVGGMVYRYPVQKVAVRKRQMNLSDSLPVPVHTSQLLLSFLTLCENVLESNWK